MMLETNLAPRTQSWSSSSPARTRKRRDSKVVYHANNSRCSPPRSVRPGSSSAGYKIESLPLRQTDNANLDLYNLPPGNGYGYNPVIHQGYGSQDGSGNSPWQQQSSLIDYTLASHHGAQSPPQYLDGNQAHAPSPPNNFYLQLSNNELASSWNSIPGNSELEDLSMMDIPYGNFDENFGQSSPTTAGTASSEGFVFPLIDTALGSPPGVNHLFDLDLSDEYFQVGQPLNASTDITDPNSPLYDENLIFENGGLPLNMAFDNMYTSTDSHWSTNTLTQSKQPSCSPVESTIMSNMPWNPEHVQVSRFQANANSGDLKFEPPLEEPYNTYKARGLSLETGPSSQGSAAPDPVSPQGDSDNESWVITSAQGSDTPSHSSPLSQASPRSHASSSRHHSHVFSSIPGTTKNKISKGRQRGLTQLEKKQAREVRDAKACWACHISKTKCSPCSPGSPCEQCTRLVGKRRFCKFTCFNDPLESLYIFLVPVYLNGHLNRTDVEAFVARNAESWGNRNMLIRMDWGHRKLIEVEVVALNLRKNAPDMGFHDTTVNLGIKGKEKLVRRQSPPLGVPLAAMDDMQDEYSRYVQDIVLNDLKSYVPVAYFPEDSKFMTRLLGVVCDFYATGLQADEESELLGKALEMHVTTSILERTLNLDIESINKVQHNLRQRYPKETTAKCAQKQIKLALFVAQQRRINRVLKEWGNMMWTIHNTASNDKKWAISFCVFLILTLNIDKVFGQAYWFCENQILHFGADPKTERAKCMHYLQLTEKELFDRCKEIFHWKFKTRKGGKEACNPIRDGMEAFRGRTVDSGIKNLTFGLQNVVREYGIEIRSHCSIKPEDQAFMGVSPYMDLGRLSCIFLDDFLDH